MGQLQSKPSADNNLYRSRSTRSFADLTVSSFRRGLRRVRTFWSKRSSTRVESFELDPMSSSGDLPPIEVALEAQSLNDKKAIEAQSRNDDAGEESSQVEGATTVEKNLEYLDFAILNDPDTINWIRKNRTVLALRGLPGSGKSTLVKAIKKFYSDLEPVICSADDFFVGDDGIYRFNAGRLKDAHSLCQSTMRDACEAGKRLIIVDNTNVQAWELNAYFSNSNKAPYTYQVIVIEPQTPWSLDPEQLAQKNSHGVDLEVLRRKVMQYENIVPIYYAWFLSPGDSRALIDRGHILFKRIYEKCDEFRENFAQYSSMLNFQSAMNYYNRDSFVSGDQYILHCTARFFGMGPNRSEEAKEYYKRKAVRNNLGSVQSIKIIGYFLTKETFGCRIELTEEQLHMYDQDESLKKLSTQRQSIWSRGCQRSTVVHKDDFKEPLTLEETTLDICDGNQRFNPNPGLGRRAHITLATAPGVKAVNAGIDLLQIVKAEKEAFEKQKAPVSEVQLPDSNDVLRQYEDNLWVLYPEFSVSVQALFTGHYDKTPFINHKSQKQNLKPKQHKRFGKF